MLFSIIFLFHFSSISSFNICFLSSKFGVLVFSYFQLITFPFLVALACSHTPFNDAICFCFKNNEMLIQHIFISRVGQVLMWTESLTRKFVVMKLCFK